MRLFEKESAMVRALLDVGADATAGNPWPRRSAPRFLPHDLCAKKGKEGGAVVI